MGHFAQANSGSTILTRRRFVRLVTLAGASLMAGPALAGLSVTRGKEKALSFYNLHTGESLRTVYWTSDGYDAAALGQINYILRDFRANEVKPIDVRLLDLLHALRQRLDTNEPYQVISGYRSPATNAMLHANSEGVAAHSLHIDGKAIDIRVPGRDLSELHQVALSMRGGGVGYYPRSDFVHVDVGRVRFW